MANIGRITNIEWLRIIAVSAVVLIHIDACYTYFFLPVTRFAVPFFFMVTGYFMGDQSRKKHWQKHIINALLLLLGATLLYATFEFFGSLFNGRSMCTWPWKQLCIKWICFNQNPFHYHLWFLGAYLYVIIIGACIDKYNLWRWMYWMIIPLFIVRFSMQAADLSAILSRNFLFIGLPCFLCGSWLRSNKSLYILRLSHTTLIWICILTATLPYGENFLWENVLELRFGDLATSYIQAFFLLLAAVELPQIHQQELPSDARNLVLGIYIIHPLVNFIYTHILPPEPLIIYNTWLAPVIVFFTSWIISVVAIQACKSIL